MRRKLILILLLAALSGAAFAEGGGIVLNITKDATLQKWNNSFMAPNVASNIEFFVGSIPAPNSAAGTLTMDNISDLGNIVAYDYSDDIPGGKTPVINGKNIYIRSWDGAMRTRGSKYGKSQAYKASFDAPAKQYDVSAFKTIYLADKPVNAPTITSITEANQRIGSTNDVVLNLTINYAYDEGSPRIEINGYDVKYWVAPENEPADTDPDRVVGRTKSETSFSLPATDPKTGKPFGSGTYYFKVRAKNWYDNGPWSDPPTKWVTLAGPVGGAIDIDLNAGVNSLGMPFSPPFKLEYAGKDYDIGKLSDLVSTLQAIGGKGMVTAVAYWNESEKQIEGATYENGAVKDPSANFNPDLPLEAGKGYQITTSKAINFKLKQ